MSKRYSPAYADPKGALIDSQVSRFLPLMVEQSTTPTQGAAGYAKGCIFINTAGSAGTTFYVNKGTTTSADWFAVT